MSDFAAIFGKRRPTLYGFFVAEDKLFHLANKFNVPGERTRKYTEVDHSEDNPFHINHKSDRERAALRIVAHAVGRQLSTVAARPVDADLKNNERFLVRGAFGRFIWISDIRSEDLPLPRIVLDKLRILLDKERYEEPVWAIDCS